MPRTFLELIGALLLWALKGFKGDYAQFIKKNADYYTASIGLTFILGSLVLIILAFRLAQ